VEHMEIAARTIFYIGPLPVTNTIFSAWIAMAVLVILSLLATRSMSVVPRGLQNVMEYIVELLLTVCESTMGRIRGRRFFPVIATSFLFILTANWVGLFPGFGDTPWLRSAASDLNITASMALIVFVLAQFWAIKSQGILGYLKEFAVPNPLHILSELSRPLSLAFRLFGNILAGEVVIITITAMVPFLLPTVFFGLEVFVGILQALIFSMLTMVFLTMATMHESHESHPEGGAH
jgi:F-type H+-transporting ATPase subunit a